MKYCKYHPLTAATYACKYCNIDLCDSCVNDGGNHERPRCFLCNKEVESYGASFGAVPFWRRLEETFRYPLNKETMIFIGVVSLVMTLITYFEVMIYLTWILYLALAGAQLKYCFTCLEKTASGQMQAPDVQGAYQGGVHLLLRLLLMVIIFSVGIGVIEHFLGASVAGLATSILIIGIPAILINFALNEDLIEAINPLNMIALITKIGLPYGLLIGLILVMMGSVSVINALLGTHLSFISVSLQAVVSNYYMVVIFHLMGYMIFQYQRRLDFVAPQVDGYFTNKRSAQELYHAHIDIALKEGDFDELHQLYSEALQRFPSDTRFYERYFDLLCHSKDVNRLMAFGSRYLKLQARNGRNDKLTAAYKRIVRLAPEFEPDTAELSHHIARSCKSQGDSVTVVKLLNGLKSKAPNYANMYDAYVLLASAMEELPGMEENVQQCRELLEKLKQSQGKSNLKASNEGKTSFVVKEVEPTVKEKPKVGHPAEEFVSQEQNKEPKELPPLDFK